MTNCIGGLTFACLPYFFLPDLPPKLPLYIHILQHVGSRLHKRPTRLRRPDQLSEPKLLCWRWQQETGACIPLGTSVVIL